MLKRLVIKFKTYKNLKRRGLISTGDYYSSRKIAILVSDLFEKEDHFGGHSHTIDLLFGTKKVSVDIGFIVFNFKTYPNLIKFFNENKIEIENL